MRDGGMLGFSITQCSGLPSEFLNCVFTVHQRNLNISISLQLKMVDYRTSSHASAIPKSQNLKISKWLIIALAVTPAQSQNLKISISQYGFYCFIIFFTSTLLPITTRTI